MSGKLLIVAPAVNSRFRHWLSDDDDARRAAEDRLRICIERFQRAGFSRVEGHVGDRDIVQAIGDALALVDADAVVVATPPSESVPLEYARDCFALPIVHVVIEPEVLHAAA